MKKLLAIVLSLLVLCASVAACAESLTFYLDTMSGEGLENVKASDIGFDMQIVLNEDGTAQITAYGETSDAQWNQADETTIEIINGEEKISFAFDADAMTLTGEEDGYLMVFTPNAPETVSFGEAVAAEDASAFDGAWTCTYLSMSGMNMSVEAIGEVWTESFGESKEIEIAEGTVTLFGTELGTFTFEDGKLVFASDEEGISQSVFFTDDGYLCYSIADTMNFYCVPAAK